MYRLIPPERNLSVLMQKLTAKQMTTGTMRAIDLFSGIGGFALAGRWCWGEQYEILSFCEFDRKCQELLSVRFPGVPIHPNVKDFDGTKYSDVDILTGGFPCQPFSVAGKREGTEDDRYLWPAMLAVIQSAKPRWVIAENVYGLVTCNNGLVLETVLSDLETEGYAVQAFVIPACAKGARHQRYRVWVIAYAEANDANDANGTKRKFCSQNGRQREPLRRQFSDANTLHDSRRSAPNIANIGREWQRRTWNGRERFANSSRWHEQAQPGQNGLVYGLSNWLDEYLSTEPDVNWTVPTLKGHTHRIHQLGNAIVPQVAYEIMRAIRDSETV